MKGLGAIRQAAQKVAVAVSNMAAAGVAAVLGGAQAEIKLRYRQRPDTVISVRYVTHRLPRKLKAFRLKDGTTRKAPWGPSSKQVEVRRIQHPDVRGKIYKPNGERECARRSGAALGPNMLSSQMWVTQ